MVVDATDYKLVNTKSVTDLISRIVQVLKRDLYWVKISVQEAGLMELVEP